MARKPFQFIDPAELSRIDDLRLLARIVVEGFMSGIHRSPHYGASVEFAQYRPYVQGDDPRFVDWGLYGRTDRLHVKEFHEETNLRCTILIDCSASMGYGSKTITKFQFARMLAACLAMILYQQKDSFGLVAYHNEIISHIPPKNTPKQFQRVLTTLDAIEPADRTDTESALHFLGHIVKPRGMVILISDLLQPLDGMIEHLKSLRARRHDVMVFQIADPAEQTFPFDRAVTLVDAESASEQYVVPDMARRQYLDNRKNHFSTLQRECAAFEIETQEFTTDEPLDHALHHFFYHRAHALMTSSAKHNKSAGGAR